MDNSGSQIAKKQPLATGRRSLVLAIACWSLLGICIFGFIYRKPGPEPAPWILATAFFLTFLGTQAFFLRPSGRERLERPFAVTGILLLALLAIWLTAPFWFIRRSCPEGVDGYAHADAWNAYTAAQAYFTDHPEEIVGLKSMKDYGLSVHSSVIVTVEDGTRSGLSIITRHGRGNKVYHVDHSATLRRYTLAE